MLLAFDVGNTNTFVGVAAADMGAPAVTSFDATWRLSTSRTRTADEWFALLEPLFRASKVAISDIDRVVIGSVVPSVTRHLSRMVERHMERTPIVVSAAVASGIVVATRHPEQTGADRIANAVAALVLVGAPAIVVDFGTATNIDVVDGDGEMVGGAIAPGISVMLEALTSRTDQLNPVALELPAGIGIGRDTTTAIQSGTVAGYLDLIEGTVHRIRAELGTDAPVLVTGGAGELFAGASEMLHRYEPNLTLSGLRLIGQHVAREAPAASAEPAPSEHPASETPQTAEDRGSRPDRGGSSQRPNGKAATSVVNLTYEIVFDGGSLGNPGQGYGSYVIRCGNEEIERRRLDFGDRVTNNQAEYRTLIAALESLLRLVGAGAGQTNVIVGGDSQLVINQVNGSWKVKHADLQPLRQRAADLLSRFGSRHLTWHRRSRSVRELGH